MTSDMDQDRPEPIAEPAEHGGNGIGAAHNKTPKAKVGRKKGAKAVPSGRTADKAQWVSSDFIRPAARRLGASLNELSDAMGLSYGLVNKYAREGTCPLWFKFALNGLLAEQEAAAATDQRPSQSLTELPSEPTHGRSGEGLIVLHLKPGELLAAKALIGMLGWKTITRED